MRTIAAIAATLAVIVSQAPAATFEYLYIEANEGNSSGGHVAVRFANQVYHFQHDEGLVRSRRDGWRRFEHHYRTLENRGISVARIETSPETYELLRSAFQRRHLVQESEITLWSELRREAQLLGDLEDAAGSAPPPPVRVRGAGFFEALHDAEDSVDTRNLAAIRAEAEARYGDGFLARLRMELTRRIAALEPASVAIEPPGSRQLAIAKPLFHERLSELNAAVIAIEVLQKPHRLSSEHLLDGAADRPLRPGERAKLQTAGKALGQSLPRLLSSRRADWGYPFLLGLARLIALERSLERGRMIFLDAIPSDAKHLPFPPRRRHTLPALLAEAQSDRDSALRQVLAEEGFDEPAWSALETAVSRVAELQRVEAGARELRVQPGVWMPQGEAAIELRPGLRFEQDRVARWRRAARRRASDYGKMLRRTYGYNLLLRNCVSEVFRTIETAFLESGVSIQQLPEASRVHLGGYVHPTAGLNFIPIVSADRVRSTYAVTENEELPSFRRYHVERMRLRELPLRVDLRESNVLTSTLYTPTEKDGFFLFFTDRTVLLRPILGAVNLVASTAKSAVGLALTPIDGGRALRSGLSGGLFSLPELFFLNLRKGSNDYVPPELRPPGAP